MEFPRQERCFVISWSDIKGFKVYLWTRTLIIASIGLIYISRRELRDEQSRPESLGCSIRSGAVAPFIRFLVDYRSLNRMVLDFVQGPGSNHAMEIGNKLESNFTSVHVNSENQDFILCIFRQKISRYCSKQMLELVIWNWQVTVPSDGQLKLQESGSGVQIL